MGSWRTRLADPPATELPSPGLLFHKWHEYDLDDRNRPELRTFDTADARPPFLRAVAGASERARRAAYEGWHTRYKEALEGAGVSQATTLAAATLWRLVVGFATNPALETGISLHPLYGFPYLPGSAVKGLVHQVAERDLLETRDDWPARADLPGDGSAEEVETFLTGAETVREIFGSLHLEPARDPEGAIVEPTARSLIAVWRARKDLVAPLRRRLTTLLDEPTGGAAVFYDAVPAVGDGELLELDLLNPHYPKYYGGSAVPSDDQNPNPVYFLALRSGARLEFRFRLRETSSAGAPKQAEETKKKVRTWLEQGLEVWGAGGKTAAGYGYFDLREMKKEETQKKETKKEVAARDSAPPQRPSPPNWQPRLQRIGWGNAEEIVEGLLRDFSGEVLRAAALSAIEKLTPREIRRRSEHQWVKDLLAAAES